MVMTANPRKVKSMREIRWFKRAVRMSSDWVCQGNYSSVVLD
jgi:hypothetical protein